MNTYPEMCTDEVEIPEFDEAAMEQARNAWIDNQEEIPASNECEGGGCIL